MKTTCSVFVAILVVLAGCSKSPYDRTRNDQGNAVGSFGVTGSMKIFSDELFSGGGAFLYPGGENQSLLFNDKSNPLSARSIRYFWSGQPPKVGDTAFTFAGVDLMHSATEPEYASTPARDLHAAGYTKVTFYIRGALTSLNVLKIEVSDDGAGGRVPPCMTFSTNGTDEDNGNPCASGLKGRLTDSWQKFTILIDPNVDLLNVKDYLKATFVFNSPLGNQSPGQGGTIYLDQIYFEP